MHQASQQPEFMKTVKDIKDAEEAYDRLIVSAKEKANELIREAKEKTLHDRTKNEENMVAFKNERIRNGSKDIEREVEKILEEAKIDAEKTSKKKADPQAVAKLLKEFLNNL